MAFRAAVRQGAHVARQVGKQTKEAFVDIAKNTASTAAETAVKEAFRSRSVSPVSPITFPSRASSPAFSTTTYIRTGVTFPAKCICSASSAQTINDKLLLIANPVQIHIHQTTSLYQVSRTQTTSNLYQT